jgi:hypothetical protein
MLGIPILKTGGRYNGEINCGISLSDMPNTGARFPYKLFINSLRHPCEMFRNMARWQLIAETAHELEVHREGHFVEREIGPCRTLPVRTRQQPPAGRRGSFQHSLAAGGAERRIGKSMAPRYAFVEFVFLFPRTLSCSKYFLKAVTRSSFVTLTFAFLLLVYGIACGVSAEDRNALAQVNVLGWRHQCRI